jgi:ADP-ribose pyrophosphatase YjhB (NUDIX family)
MKKLVRIEHELTWLPGPCAGRLFLTDEMPPSELCRSVFGFVFYGPMLLLANLRIRGWDLPGGWVLPNESPQQAIVREVRESTGVHSIVKEVVGLQELEFHCPQPPDPRWNHPHSTIVFFICEGHV